MCDDNEKPTSQVLGQHVRIVSEEAGPGSYGKKGAVISVSNDGSEVEVLLDGYILSKRFKTSWCQATLPESLQFPKLTSVTKAMKRKLLQKANLHGDGCDKIEIIEKKQEEILAQHIEIAYHFMMMAWSVDDSKIAFLDPKLIELCLLGVSHDVKDEDKAEYQSKHNQRCKVLLEMSQCDLVLCPIFSSGPSQHWTFMSIKGDRVRYYDTL
jgi:hypothetical protein